MSLFANGQYQISSPQFPGQVADLLGGQPTAVIAGYHNTNDTASMWNLINVGSQGNQFQLTNAASAASGQVVYAGATNITEGVELHGSSAPLSWTILPTCTSGQYWILAPMAAGLTTPSGLVWSLDSGADQTPITLMDISYSVPQTLATRNVYSQAWSFLPMK
jgi:hypothetical protein